LHGNFGHVAELKQLLAESKNRKLQGSVEERKVSASEALS